ncbi:hypothetical protein KAZ57_03715 [Patescibacteria group bacterium]|nr:hypothetical protein [Patescibacteria group bacterium]
MRISKQTLRTLAVGVAVGAIFILILVACQPAIATTQSYEQYSGCATGMQIMSVPLTNVDTLLASGQALSAFVVMPNKGCNLEAKSCILFVDTGGRGGISCQPEVLGE